MCGAERRKGAFIQPSSSAPKLASPEVLHPPAPSPPSTAWTQPTAATGVAVAQPSAALVGAAVTLPKPSAVAAPRGRPTSGNSRIPPAPNYPPAPPASSPLLDAPAPSTASVTPGIARPVPQANLKEQRRGGTASGQSVRQRGAISKAKQLPRRPATSPVLEEGATGKAAAQGGQARARPSSQSGLPLDQLAPPSKAEGPPPRQPSAGLDPIPAKLDPIPELSGELDSSRSQHLCPFAKTFLTSAAPPSGPTSQSGLLATPPGSSKCTPLLFGQGLGPGEVVEQGVLGGKVGQVARPPAAGVQGGEPGADMPMGQELDGRLFQLGRKLGSG